MHVAFITKSSGSRGMRVAARRFMELRGVTLVLALAGLGLACGRGEDAPPRSPEGNVRTTSGPPLEVDPAPGTLAARQVQSAVAERMPSVRQRCGSIDREIARYEATLHLEIGASGAVEVADARGNHPLVDACVSEVARSWQFAAAGGRTIAEVPIVLVDADPDR